MTAIVDGHLPPMEAAIGTAGACRVLGKARSTFYRQRRPAPPRVPAPRPPVHHPAELSAAERERILAVLASPRFADKSVAQVYTILLDEGVYLASPATMHRLLRERGQAGERRAQATHPPRVKPELVAAAPNQVWSWDITKLRGPARGVWYLLYVILDIFSRRRCTSRLADRDRPAGQGVPRTPIAANGGVAPRAVHADQGTSMTSNTVAGLYAKLNIARSHSRPHVSNDNPYSEAAFKTLKYCPAFPEAFGSIEDANTFCAAFFGYYNHDHRHSGVAMHTPASVHDGTWRQVHEQRAATLRAAYVAHPERFHGRCPAPKPLPTRVWINEPPTTIETDASLQNEQVA